MKSLFVWSLVFSLCGCTSVSLPKDPTRSPASTRSVSELCRNRQILAVASARGFNNPAIKPNSESFINNMEFEGDSFHALVAAGGWGYMHVRGKIDPENPQGYCKDVTYQHGQVPLWATGCTPGEYEVCSGDSVFARSSSFAKVVGVLPDRKIMVNILGSYELHDIDFVAKPSFCSKGPFQVGDQVALTSVQNHQENNVLACYPNGDLHIDQGMGMKAAVPASSVKKIRLSPENR